MLYRYATISDIPKIESLLEKVKYDFLRTRKGKRSSLKRSLLNQKYKMIIALDKSKIIGYVAYKFKSKKEAKLIGIAVLKNYRGKDIGKKLFDKSIKDMQKRGIKRIITRTWEKNHTSQKLMKSFGFKLYRTIFNDRINGESTCWFKREFF